MKSEILTMTLPDYSNRDATIRHLTYTPLRRREGMPHALFDAYWRDVHGPLCARLPGLGFYAQHHFDRDRSANLWPLPEGVDAIDTVLDGMVEIGFADQDGQTRFTEASPILFADERNFIGHDVAYELPEGSRTLVDHDPDAVPNREETGHRLHLHLHGSGDAFEAGVTAFAEALSSAAGIVKVRLHFPKPYHNSSPSPEAPDVDHMLSRERKRVALIETAWVSRLAATAYQDSEAYAEMADRLGSVTSAMGAYLVSGVYTFIRDGRLTTAGLRGSRPAALIEKMGALNQTKEDVTRLFHRG